MSALPSINGFKLIEVIGTGGMATVYSATRLSDNLKVAIKVLHDHVEKIDKNAKERFIKEANFTLNLKHPNLLKTFLVSFMDNGSPYMVMELIKGKSIQEIVKAKKTLSARNVIIILQKVTDALIYLHKKDIIHRDIKPGNIMFEVKTKRVLLMDFGIARSISDSSNLTSTGAIIGTPKYLSPEQAKGTKDITVKSDVYSLGICLFHMLTGHPPFTADEPMAVILMHLEMPLPSLPKDYSDIQSLLEKMCHKNSEQRISSKDLASELRVLLMKTKINEWPVIDYGASKTFIEEHFTQIIQQEEEAAKPQKPEAKSKLPLFFVFLLLVSTIGYSFSDYLGFTKKEAIVKVVSMDRQINIQPSHKGSQIYIDDLLIGKGKISNFTAKLGKHKITAIEHSSGTLFRWFGEQFVNVSQHQQSFILDMSKEYIIADKWVSKAEYLKIENEQNLVSQFNTITALINQRKFFDDKEAVSLFHKFQKSSPFDIRTTELITTFENKFNTSLKSLIDNNKIKQAKNLISQIDNNWQNPDLTLTSKTLITALLKKKATLLKKKASKPKAIKIKKVKAKIINRACVTCPTMVLIPSGSYTFGSNKHDADEKPQIDEKINTFYASKTLVSNSHFVHFLNYKQIPPTINWININSSRLLNTNQKWSVKAGFENHPVTSISLTGAIQYSQFLSSLGNKNYHLPNELEWEYSASSGNKSSYWWGNQFDSQKANALGKKDNYSSTSPVDAFPVNKFNLHDAVGNVWQWTVSEYQPYPSENYKKSINKLHSNSNKFAIRGGSHLNGPNQLRVTNRSSTIGTTKSSRIGFRVIYK